MIKKIKMNPMAKKKQPRRPKMKRKVMMINLKQKVKMKKLEWIVIGKICFISKIMFDQLIFERLKLIVIILVFLSNFEVKSLKSKEHTNVKKLMIFKINYKRWRFLRKGSLLLFGLVIKYFCFESNLNQA